MEMEMKDMLCTYDVDVEEEFYLPEDAYEIEELSIQEALLLVFGKKITSPRDMLWA